MNNERLTKVHFKMWRLCCITVVALSQWGFVLLSADKAVLPATVAQPTINFLWSGDSPSIEKKDEFEGGIYADLDDEAFMEQLLNMAVDQWNNVKGSFLKLKIERTNTEQYLEGEDKINVIVVDHTSNISTAAYASPKIDPESKHITDCDISIADRATSAQSLAFTIVHELGHCIGLGHAHTNYGAIMGYSRDVRKPRLGADDMAGIIYLYPDPAYGSATPKEMIPCGVVGRSQDEAKPKGFIFLLLLTPALFAWRRLRKN